MDEESVAGGRGEPRIITVFGTHQYRQRRRRKASLRLKTTNLGLLDDDNQGDKQDAIDDVAFPPNDIHTTKYTSWPNFIARFLYEQFSKYANMYFGCIALIQQIPGVAPTSKLATVIPLSFIMMVSAGRELWEDHKRSKADRAANNKEVLVLVPKTQIERQGKNDSNVREKEEEEKGGYEVKKRRWAELVCGDVVKVMDGEEIPADMVLLATFLPDHLAYVETSSIDGETNLKVKQALPQTPPPRNQQRRRQ